MFPGVFPIEDDGNDRLLPSRTRTKAPACLDETAHEVVGGRVLEVALSLKDLAGLQAVSFFVALYNGANREVERHPPHRPIALKVPDARFDALHWTA